jgi:hypothetical protein
MVIHSEELGQSSLRTLAFFMPTLIVFLNIRKRYDHRNKKAAAHPGNFFSSEDTLSFCNGIWQPFLFSA